MNSTRVTQLIGQLQTLYRDGWQSKSAHTTQRDALHQALLEIAQTDVDAFAPLLRTGDSFAILTAMEILSNSGHDRAAEVLLPAFINPMHRAHREGMVRALARLQDPDVVAPLLDRLGMSDPEFDLYAMRALGRMHVREGLEVFRAAAVSDNPQRRAAGVEALGQLGEGRDLLISTLTDPEPQVRAAAAEALGEIGAAETINDLLPLLDDADPAVRDAGALALGLLGEARVAERLRMRLRGFVPPETMLRLMQALARLGDANAAPGLIEVLTNSYDQEVLIEAAAALLHIDADHAIEPLGKLLRSNAKPMRARRYVAERLSALDAERAVPPLLAVLRDNAAPIPLRCFVAEQLGHLADKRAVLPLKMLADAPNNALREAARAALPLIERA
jgi:HEAT repeat protein